MKKIFFPALLISQMAFSQYLIVGKDSISVRDYIRDNKYGLENVGVDKTVNATVDFLLLQQLAKEKKADTLNYFNNAVNQRLNELREQKFYPKTVIEPLVKDFVNSSRNEIQVMVFVKQKSPDDKTNYKALYNDVKSGKLTMEEAITKHVSADAAKAFYIKPGMLDYDMYQQIKDLSVGSYTPFIDKPNAVGFAKVINKRPSLGYLIFGVLSYPNNAEAEATKTKIYNELAAGKKFQLVVREYGETEEARNSGGVVMGSPILPDEVYDALKGHQKDYYTKEPILFGDKYFIFNIYNIYPYELKEDNFPFFKKEMMATSYGEEATARLMDLLKRENKFSETKDFAEIKKSYNNFTNFKNNKAVLATYGNRNFLFEDFKRIITEKYKELDKATPEQWAEIANAQTDQFVLGAYSQDFANLPEIKPSIDELKKNLYSDYIFSDYLRKEVDNNPQLFEQYYQENKSKFVWEKRAESRAAVISDPKLVKEIEKQIKDKKLWKNLQEKYKDKVNENNLVLVHFEEGKIQESAEIFKKYNVPFKKGIFTTQINNRDVVISIDELLPEQPMTLEEAKPEMEDAITEMVLQKTIANQKAKTKVEIQPQFLDELYKNFKK